MGTLEDKLAYINQTKFLIKQGLNELDAGITDSDTFRSYVGKIEDIYDDYPKETDEGTSVELNNVIETARLGTELKGNTSQEGTPTPSSPIDVNVVTGYNKVVVSNNLSNSQEYEVNLGKNLFKPFSYTRTHNHVNFTYSEDGTIIANGTATSGATSIASSTALSNGYYAVLEAGTYTLSGGTGNSNIRLQALNTDGTSILSLQSNTSGSFTLTEKTNVFLRVYVYSGTTADNIVIKPQLEKGSLTPYAPYFEPIELCKIGTYQDKIFRQNGTWYLHKEVGKVVLNGSEDWSNVATSSGTRAFQTDITNNAVGRLTNQFMSDKFLQKSSADWNTEGFINKSTTSSTIYLFIQTTRANSVGELQTWLGTNNVTLYYVYETPTDTEITNQALISQLEALYHAKSYEQTIINQTNSDLPFIITASGLKKGG